MTRLDVLEGAGEFALSHPWAGRPIDLPITEIQLCGRVTGREVGALISGAVTEAAKEIEGGWALVSEVMWKRAK